MKPGRGELEPIDIIIQTVCMDDLPGMVIQGVPYDATMDEMTQYENVKCHYINSMEEEAMLYHQPGKPVEGKIDPVTSTFYYVLTPAFIDSDIRLCLSLWLDEAMDLDRIRMYVPENILHKDEKLLRSAWKHYLRFIDDIKKNFIMDTLTFEYLCKVLYIEFQEVMVK
jgi:hypothetical protein